MAGMEQNSASAAPSQVFLTEDIITNHILLQLPTASCIARCRCVCKSWRALLSDPDFIRRFIFFQTPADRRSLRILISGPEKGVVPARKIYYSLHSYETLCPIVSETVEDHLHLMPSIPYKMHARWPQFRLDIVGYCDGIFCISDVNHCGAGDVILWNPTTSEIKYLPLSPCPHPITLEAFNQHTGFGFDPVTRDYKVVRRMEFRRDPDEYYDEEEEDQLPPEFVYSEVYSLRNDSWKRLSIDVGDNVHTIYCSDFDYVRLYCRAGTSSRNETCYWFNHDCEGECRITSFRTSEEVFEVVELALPSGKTDHWYLESCFLLKDWFVVTISTFENADSPIPYELWGLMNGALVSESWTKLFTFELSPHLTNSILEVWKDGMYICSLRSDEDKKYSTSDHADEEVDAVYILDPTMWKIDNHLDLKWRTHEFQVHTYTPTHISLSSLE